MDIREVNTSESFEVEINDWWVQARYRELIQNISFKQKSMVVDIGCGSAQNLYFLCRDYPHLKLIGVDHESAQIDYNWLSKRVEIINTVEGKIFDSNVFLLMDVLEHIDKDQEFLSQIVERAKHGSEFFISVPSFPVLWSQRDVELGHFRRYTNKTIRDLCANSGLTIDSCYYKYSFLFLVLFLVRKRIKSVGIESRWGRSSGIVTKILDSLCRLEEKIPKLPIGTSIILVGYKE